MKKECAKFKDWYVEEGVHLFFVQMVELLEWSSKGIASLRCSLLQVQPVTIYLYSLDSVMYVKIIYEL